MGVPSDDVVLIQIGKKAEDPTVVTVNCPDKPGLGCDIYRTVLDFGLYIVKADVSTDGIWCYIVLWVVQRPLSLVIKWSNLKDRLFSMCPSCIPMFYFNQSPRSVSPPVYLLKFFSLDRKGLLHDVTHVLCELELTIQRVKVTTTPDGKVLDLFFITDNLELLHTKERQDETCKRLHDVLGQSYISCELNLAGPEYQNHQSISSITPISEELFSSEFSSKENNLQASFCPYTTKLKQASVTVDNSLSPTHTLLQIQCVDHKGLPYDIMRTLKDYNIKISHGRFLPNSKGYREIDLFIQQKDGKKLLDADKQNVLCSRLKMEMLHPLRVTIVNRGPDIELLVANPVELSGTGRPRVFYDATLALKRLGICIFSAEIGRHSTLDREWEFYRFLLDENCDFGLSNCAAKNQIVDRVRRTLMGCTDSIGLSGNAQYRFDWPFCFYIAYGARSLFCEDYHITRIKMDMRCTVLAMHYDKTVGLNVQWQEWGVFLEEASPNWCLGVAMNERISGFVL